jgi:hypothetical protein
VLPARAQAKNDYVSKAPNQRFYRVLLVKHTVYGSKKRIFTVNMVEALEKVQGGDKQTTTLIARIAL